MLAGLFGFVFLDVGHGVAVVDRFLAQDYREARGYPHHGDSSAHHAAADYGDWACACVRLGPWG